MAETYPIARPLKLNTSPAAAKAWPALLALSLRAPILESFRKRRFVRCFVVLGANSPSFMSTSEAVAWPFTPCVFAAVNDFLGCRESLGVLGAERILRRPLTLHFLCCLLAVSRCGAPASSIISTMPSCSEVILKGPGGDGKDRTSDVLANKGTEEIDMDSSAA
ncbi:hypothetical protein GOP47_0005516 [Adiantum capillus-veneris]|uniref:Uncharacterized protein n=1 Tax=Adiantum capillus-veneris TaxID=13818 RepID=A0A9D4V6V8_ADICA|nr:hypothetical protein GOP47_0005516 [Adiantum capillus-veneris]